jgi:3-deoxy-D-manno-octulosonic-acid transferase
MPGNVLGEAALSLYGAAGRAAAPAAQALLSWRERRGKEDHGRRGERLGIAKRPRPPGRLVWIHAASVGETMTALPLAERLVERNLHILLTTGTVTAAQVAGDRLPPKTIHQFAPIDTPVAVDQFLDHWRPDFVLFAESEFWPTILKALDRRAVPLVVVNARMSERSFRAWRVFPPLARAILGRVSLFVAQTDIDAARLRSLGADRVLVSGNLKFDAPAPPSDEDVVARMRAEIGNRTILVAASTHPGEEASILRAQAEVGRAGARLLTIIAPRHPERGDQLAAEIRAAGFSLRRRSRGERIDPATDVYLADTIGEMGLWYRLADIGFLGGSMVPHGGQNPIEAAKLGVPVLHGPHVANFRAVYEALGEASATREVRSEGALVEMLRLLIEDAGEREGMAKAAARCIAHFTGSLDRTLGAIEPYLAPLVQRDEAPAGA